MRRALGAKALQRIAPHLTLVPPLNIAEQSLEDVLGQVRAAGRASGPMAVELGPPSTFWPRTPVVFLELSGDISCVGALRRDLVAGPLAPPKGRDERDFVPHVTLDQSIDPARIPHALAALADYRASYCFERVTVLEQDAEHRWHPMADVALGKPMVVGRGSLELELAVVDQVDPLVAAWAEELWNAYSRERYGPQDVYKRQHLLRRDHAAFDLGAVPLVHRPDPGLDLEDLRRPVRRAGAGVHLLAAHDPLLRGGDVREPLTTNSRAQVRQTGARKGPEQIPTRSERK